MLRRLSFNLWYFGRPPWDSGISPPELLDFLGDHAPGRAIDLGCGTGTNVITLAQHGWQVTGIDFASRAIQIARRKIQRANIRAEVRVGDVTKLRDVLGPFDLGLDMGCFHGVEDKVAYLNGLARLLATGGHWLMYGRLKDAPSIRLDTARLDPSPRLSTALAQRWLGQARASLGLVSISKNVNSTECDDTRIANRDLWVRRTPKRLTQNYW
jgi:SAM-dependent methyltransferase